MTAEAELVVLGSGGWIPTQRRATCCALVLSGRDAVLIDAGTGVSRLIAEPGLLDGVERLHLALTHFHLDHVIGLPFLPALPLRPVIWGPGALLYGTPTRTLLERLADPPLFGGLDALCESVEEVYGTDLTLGELVLSLRVQERHSAPTLAYRYGDLLCYCTDTASDPGTAAFADGVTVLCHDAWFTTDAPSDPSVHTSGAQAAAIAAQARVDELIGIHLSPLPGVPDAVLAEARAVFPNTTLGEDGLRRTAVGMRA